MAENYKIRDIQLGKDKHCKIYYIIENNTKEELIVKIYENSRHIYFNNESNILRKLNNNFPTQENNFFVMYKNIQYHQNMFKIPKEVKQSNLKFLFYDYLPKLNLIDYVFHNNKRIEEIHSKFLCYKLLIAIDKLHSIDISHNNIDVSNIIFDDNFDLKIIHFSEAEIINKKLKLNNDIFGIAQIIAKILTKGKFRSINYDKTNKSFIIYGNDKLNNVPMKESKFWKMIKIFDNIDISEEFLKFFHVIINAKKSKKLIDINDLLKNEWLNEIEKNILICKNNFQKDFEELYNIIIEDNKKSSIINIDINNLLEDKDENDLFSNLSYPKYPEIENFNINDNIISNNNKCEAYNIIDEDINPIQNLNNVFLNKKKFERDIIDMDKESNEREKISEKEKLKEAEFREKNTEPFINEKEELKRNPYINERIISEEDEEEEKDKNSGEKKDSMEEDSKEIKQKKKNIKYHKSYKEYSFVKQKIKKKTKKFLKNDDNNEKKFIEKKSKDIKEEINYSSEESDSEEESSYSGSKKKKKSKISDISMNSKDSESKEEKSKFKMKEEKRYSKEEEVDNKNIKLKQYSMSEEEEEENIHKLTSKEKNLYERIYIPKYEQIIGKKNVYDEKLRSQNKKSLNLNNDLIPNEEEYFNNPRKNDFNYLEINIKNNENKDLNKAIRNFIKKLKDKIKETYNQAGIEINFIDEKDNTFRICFTIKPLNLDDIEIEFLDEEFGKKINDIQYFEINVKLVEGNKNMFSSINIIPKYYLLFNNISADKEDFYKNIKILKNIAKNILLNLKD